MYLHTANSNKELWSIWGLKAAGTDNFPDRGLKEIRRVMP